eukprot:TRINITY_DN537_c3_g1_i2.p1 TRINITY_DN537_c3_g1~~TRINITY_DN537_c3_g1_i2.p1  ORF type:complete len:172 (+),score=38.34 TRINITY_DN537_c3_g1_i2:93-608(+)
MEFEVQHYSSDGKRSSIGARHRYKNSSNSHQSTHSHRSKTIKTSGSINGAPTVVRRRKSTGGITTGTKTNGGRKISPTKFTVDSIGTSTSGQKHNTHNRIVSTNQIQTSWLKHKTGSRVESLESTETPIRRISTTQGKTSFSIVEPNSPSTTTILTATNLPSFIKTEEKLG